MLRWHVNDLVELLKVIRGGATERTSPTLHAGTKGGRWSHGAVTTPAPTSSASSSSSSREEGAGDSSSGNTKYSWRSLWGHRRDSLGVTRALSLLTRSHGFVGDDDADESEGGGGGTSHRDADDGSDVVTTTSSSSYPRS